MINKWIERIYGQAGRTVYLSRLRLMNNDKNRLVFKNGLYIHKFHRGDGDRDFHDHPWDFWTFPFRTYYEDVLTADGLVLYRQCVQGWRWHFRNATHTHRVIEEQPFPLYTLMIPQVKSNEWGFYVNREDAYLYPAADYQKSRGNRVWVHWTVYT